MPFGSYSFGVKKTLFYMGPDPKGRGDLGANQPAETCNYKLQPNRQSYAATWRIQTENWADLYSDSAFCQIIFVLA